MSVLSHPCSEASLAVVTGFGIASAIGVGAENFWQAVRSGRNGTSPVRSFDTKGLRNRIGCEIEDALLADAVQPAWHGLPRASRLAAVAGSEALSSAGLEPDAVDGLCVGTTMGDLPQIERDLGQLGRDGKDTEFSGILETDFAARIARALGIRGPALTIATSCSAGNIAIFRAVDLIAAGTHSRVLAGGADAFSELAFIGFSRMRAMAPERCTPFSRDRKGMLLGEGSGFLVVESLRSARQRGARIYAAVVGYGLSCDAHHIATPDASGRGAAIAMGVALRRARLRPSEVDYVSAHGTGTPANDLAESRACDQVFGGHRPYVSSLKALVGHSLGAASALEAVACVLSLRDQRFVPAWNVEEPDPDCPVRLPLPGAEEDRPAPIEVVVSNAFAFGGNNSCLAMRRFD
jgi:3-oxoacyl-[acyl-carrier-protein] synthase II